MLKKRKEMSEDSKSSGSSGTLGCLGAGLGLAALVGLFTLGPIDLARTGYNAVVGDVPYIRAKAIDYCRRGISKENSSLTGQEVEQRLASELKYGLKSGERINPQEVRMLELWDATEEHADGWYDRWVWPSLGQQ